MSEDERLGKIAYEAYGASGGGVLPPGWPQWPAPQWPAWEEQPRPIQAAWIAAADAVADDAKTRSCGCL